MSRPGRPSAIPNGSWPRRMPASLATGYCGESAIDAFLKRVGKEYCLPRLEWALSAIFMTARVEDLKIKLNDAEERSKMLMEAKNHWMDRALCAEQERDDFVRAMENTARELGCATDNEAIFFAIAKLKQERDEAYERLKPFAKINPVEIAFAKSEKSFRIDYDAAFQDQLSFRHFRAARDLVRQLASGPEKEEK